MEGPKTDVVRIAMWSGPRNLSTALMRSWENRPDTAVLDEPFYAYYLSRTGIDHPGKDAVLASQDTDWRRVVERLTGPVPGNARILYQKHMTHHLLPEVHRSRLAGLRHAFLIRHPREVLASYARVRAQPTLDDLGFPQQSELFGTFGGPVIDARDILTAPEPALKALCGELGVPFCDRMLSWPAGPRESDGVWGRYWYDSVWRSTGFAPYRPPTEPLPDRLLPLLENCMPFYEELVARRITVDGT